MTIAILVLGFVLLPIALPWLIPYHCGKYSSEICGYVPLGTAIAIFLVPFSVAFWILLWFRQFSPNKLQVIPYTGENEPSPMVEISEDSRSVSETDVSPKQASLDDIAKKDDEG